MIEQINVKVLVTEENCMLMLPRKWSGFTKDGHTSAKLTPEGLLIGAEDTKK